MTSTITGLTFEQAASFLVAYKNRIRRRGWASNLYVIYRPEQWRATHELTVADFEAADWEVKP